MKRYRILFVLAVTLLVATPSFAEMCGYCDRWGDCWAQLGLGTACGWDENNWCYEVPDPWTCGSGFAAADAGSLSATLAIASVEVITPDGVKHATAPAEREPARTARLERDTTR